MAPRTLATRSALAFGQGSEATAEAAGAVILDRSLERVDELLHIGRRMRSIALQSAVGGIALSLVAATGYLPPVTGAITQEVIDVLAGEFDKTKWLKGAKLGVAPIAPIKGWHATSPDLSSTSALWTRWGADGMTKFLETAKNPRGGAAGAPMPAYTMRLDDAEAIVAYLKSLP